jgi:hypothetical protein
VLRRLDEWLIGKLEKRLQSFQRWSGIDCITLDRWLNLFVGGAVALEVGALIERGHSASSYVSQSVSWFAAAVWFLALSGYLRNFFFERDFEALRRIAIGYGLANPYKCLTSAIGLRLVLLVSLPIPVGVSWLFFAHFLGQHDWLGFFWVAMLFHQYVKACDPLPPCRGKVREWIDSVGTAKLKLVAGER